MSLNVPTPPRSPIDIFSISPARAMEGLSRRVTEILKDGEQANSEMTPPASPIPGPMIVGHVDGQRCAIARRFSSKQAPDIAVDEYLRRIQQFCPLSTAVYMSAAIYLSALAQLVPITIFTVHRLLLAALRIACKNLEDMSHSQKRFAKAGGLAASELSRLEIGKWISNYVFNARVPIPDGLRHTC